jgi:TIR domain
LAGSVPPAASGRIFISYRRNDTAYAAGWLYERLAGRFGGGQVFKDVDSIQLGDDFGEVIVRAVGSCDVLLALIGEEWLTATDEHGRRRLDNAGDFVRLEIEAALSRRVRVIPVLVDGARMPRADELPDSLAALVRRQALELSPARFDFDTGRLLRVLDRTLAEAQAAQPGAGPAPPPAAPAGGPPSADGPSRRPPFRQRFSARAQVLAGVVAGVAVILVIVAVVVNSGATPAAPRAGSTTSSPATSSTPNGVVFRDDFSSKAAGWTPYDAPSTGRYADHAYIVSAPPSADGNGAGASPTKESSVYPSAPSDIRIEVQGRRLPSSDPSMEYGVGCRVHGVNGYALTISGGLASIGKYGASYKLLKQVPFRVNAYAANRLQATCANVKGKKAVRLQLFVNGQEAIETTDTDSPLPTGTVGLFVGTSQTTRASVAEFGNFAVSRI